MISESTELNTLRAEEAELERRLQKVREDRARLERRTKKIPAERGRPLRENVLDLLAESAVPLNSLLIANVMNPLQGRKVASTRFGTLSNDEAKSFDSSRSKPVYLGHCLTYDQGQAVKRFWTRSDWPIENRIMGPMSGRIFFLNGAAWIIRIARSVSQGKRVASNPEILNYLAADQARDAGLHVKRGDFPYDDWLASLDALVERHRNEDEAVRKEAARRLMEQLSERDLLFGATSPLVSLPGTKAGWVSTDER